MTHTADPEARITEIREGAIVRRLLGERAAHRRLPDGRHEVHVDGRRFTGVTLTETLDNARRPAP